MHTAHTLSAPQRYAALLRRVTAVQHIDTNAAVALHVTAASRRLAALQPAQYRKLTGFLAKFQSAFDNSLAFGSIKLRY